MSKWAAALKGVLPGGTGESVGPPRTDAKSHRSDDASAADPHEADRPHSYAPVVWLLGKVQSGKTSVIRAITGSSDAEIGDGFRPCTRTSRLYAFPQDMPVLRFLDTRGLGEVDYDPAEDMAFNERTAHIVLVTMRAMDTDQRALFEAVRQIRVRHPEWPIVIAQTSLHEAYPPGGDHILPYAFEASAPRDAIARIPPDLMRALAHQRTLFDKLPGRGALLFVPIDLTRPEDALPPADYGLDALTEALAIVAPAGMLSALAAMPGFKVDPKARSADPVVMGHAMAAAGSDLVPIPVAGAIAASTIQARMLSQLGRLYGIQWDRRAYTELTAAIGAGTAAKVAAGIGLRQLAKLLPVYGQTAGAAASAAASFAVTYALGKAAVYYLHSRRLGTTDRGGIAAAYQEALREAFRMARDRNRVPEQHGGSRP
ncbi:DUF697 domain-containing protein [uncultured Hyphomicrobium sp.]|uniref:YcjF family protein n=1 Tax=uncultured Hyphomicrobium sp. TaxID=194373 RepID=UPI0025D11013|nr:DUF697 domain-containing protein [uncultured Hyphomicrobium sp.]